MRAAVCDRTANPEEGSTESVMAGDTVALCSDILDMATVCDHGHSRGHGCMSTEREEQKERRRGKRGGRWNWLVEWAWIAWMETQSFVWRFSYFVRCVGSVHR